MISLVQRAINLISTYWTFEPDSQEVAVLVRSMKRGGKSAELSTWKAVEFLRENQEEYRLALPASEGNSGQLSVVLLDLEERKRRSPKDIITILKIGGFEGELVSIRIMKPLLGRRRKSTSAI